MKTETKVLKDDKVTDEQKQWLESVGFIKTSKDFDFYRLDHKDRQMFDIILNFVFNVGAKKNCWRLSLIDHNPDIRMTYEDFFSFDELKDYLEDE